MTSRRRFIRRAAGLSLVPAAMTGLLSACDMIPPFNGGGGSGDGGGGTFTGYGPLTSEVGPVAIPEGFQISTFGAIGAEMSDGNLTPIAHDGMAAFAAGGPGSGRIRLLRNHEDRNGPTAPLVAESAYDRLGGGGVVTLEVDRNRNLVRDFVSLSGTIVNCAGGPTPWGSWLTCEETTAGTASGYEKPHGYVYEVPSSAEGPVAPVPLKAMGRFSHEAIAMDPSSGIVYLTEDGASGFYRFLPNQVPGGQGSLQAGGRLQMLKVEGQPRIELFNGQMIGQTYDTAWVDIDEVDPPDAEENPNAVFQQGFEQGGARFDRLEGCWYGENSIFFHDTSGGDVGAGQVWRYLPGQEQLALIFESPGTEVLDSPDNLTVSPHGGIIMCEDGGSTDYVRGLTPEGQVYDLMRNNLNEAEWAGATFSPDGQTLFVNIQGATSGTPAEAEGQGLTIALWGPWGGRGL